MDKNVKWYRCKRDIRIVVILMLFAAILWPMMRGEYVETRFFFALMAVFESMLVCRKHFWPWTTVILLWLIFICLGVDTLLRPIVYSRGFTSLAIDFCIRFFIGDFLPLALLGHLVRNTLPSKVDSSIREKGLWYLCRNDLRITVSLMLFVFIMWQIICIWTYERSDMALVFLVIMAFAQSVSVCVTHVWEWAAIASFGFTFSCKLAQAFSAPDFPEYVVEYMTIRGFFYDILHCLKGTIEIGGLMLIIFLSVVALVSIVKKIKVKF